MTNSTNTTLLGFTDVIVASYNTTNGIANYPSTSSSTIYSTFSGADTNIKLRMTAQVGSSPTVSVSNTQVYIVRIS